MRPVAPPMAVTASFNGLAAGAHRDSTEFAPGARQGNRYRRSAEVAVPDRLEDLRCSIDGPGGGDLDGPVEVLVDAAGRQVRRGDEQQGFRVAAP